MLSFPSFQSSRLRSTRTDTPLKAQFVVRATNGDIRTSSRFIVVELPLIAGSWRQTSFCYSQSVTHNQTHCNSTLEHIAREFAVLLGSETATANSSDGLLWILLLCESVDFFHESPLCLFCLGVFVSWSWPYLFLCVVDEHRRAFGK